MIYGKKEIFIVFLLTLLAGSGLHFLYSLCPNPVTALVSPVRESLWEHVKLLYWPYLISALWITRGRPRGMRPWLLTLPLLCGAMLLLGYLYHVVLGGNSVWVDVGLYALLLAAGFCLPRRWSGPFRGRRWDLPLFLTILLGGLVVLFTFLPPSAVLFTDLSGAGAWRELIC